MESFIIETLSCPLDFNLSKSVQEPLKQDSSHTYTSDYSGSTDEESENKNDLIEQFEKLSFVEARDSKYITHKPTNKTSEVNSQKEDSSGEPILVENNEITEIQSSSSSLKVEESLKFVAEADVESTFRNRPNKNCEIYSKNKSDTEKVNFVGNLESVKTQLSSLSLKNNKILNKCYKNNCGIYDDDESDSDGVEQAESIILRERGHTKHNRPRNKKNQRPVPFTQNAPSTSSRHFNPNNFQTFENFSTSASYDFYTSNVGNDSNSDINTNDLETNGAVNPSSTVLYSDFSTSEWETHQIFESVASSTMTDEVINNGVPYIADTDPECVVPSEERIRNLNDQFSSEPNETPFFDNSNERSFSGYAEGYVDPENSSDSGTENLTEEDLRNILRSVTDSTSDNRHGQNPVNVSSENLLQFSNEYLNIISVFSDSSIADRNVYPSSSTLYSDFPASEWETHEIFGSRISSTTTDEVVDVVPYTADAEPKNVVPSEEYFINLNDQFSAEINDAFFDNSNERSFSGYADVNVDTENSLTSSTENLTEEDLRNILRSFTDSTSDDLYGQNPVDISNENLVQLSNEDLDTISVSSDSSIPDQNGIQYIETIYPNNNQEGQARNNINQTNTSSNRTEETKIKTFIGTAARNVLFNSPSFCKTKWNSEYEDIRQKIQSGQLGTEEKTVIYMIPKRRTTKYRGTNLHYAIREENIERVFCLVEFHKEFHGGLTEINLVDNSNKTVLDYSKEKGFDLLTAYLEENTGKSFSNICN